jgi:hypothetical protein
LSCSPVQKYEHRNKNRAQCSIIFTCPEWPAWMYQKDFQMAFLASMHDQTCTSFRYRGSLTIEQTRLFVRDWFLIDFFGPHFIVWEDP